MDGAAATEALEKLQPSELQPKELDAIKSELVCVHKFSIQYSFKKDIRNLI